MGKPFPEHRHDGLLRVNLTKFDNSGWTVFIGDEDDDHIINGAFANEVDAMDWLKAYLSLPIEGQASA